MAKKRTNTPTIPSAVARQAQIASKMVQERDAEIARLRGKLAETEDDLRNAQLRAQLRTKAERIADAVAGMIAARADGASKEELLAAMAQAGIVAHPEPVRDTADHDCG